MPEWVAVVLAGALGGSMGTLLPAGTEFPWPRLLQGTIDDHVVINLLAHLVRNTLLGAVASFVIWGLANPGLEFDTASVTVGEIAAAIIVGGGGVSLLNNLFQQSAKLDSRNEALQMSAALMDAEIEDEDG
jgi:hypothetical protein